MRFRLSITTTAVLVLVLGLLAGPALAQEGFTEDSCGEGILLVAPEGFTLDDLPSDLTLEEICAIYGVEVLEVVEEEPEEPEEEPIVLADELVATGVDTGPMVLLGAALLALGVLAVRRPRRRVSER